MMRRMEDVSNTATPDYILHRLDMLDTRLKQLEEKQGLQLVPESYFSRDLHHPETSHQCRPLSSALQEVHFKGTLMDRLRLLETRILQISYELDKGNAESSSIKAPDEIGLLQHAHDRKRHMFSSCGFNRRPDSSSDKVHKSFLPLQGQSPSLKAKELKESSSVAQQNKCRNEKRTDNNRACRRWFAIGC
ncbi:putative Vacuolar iron transporter family protein [Cinnamomum micranthum f. kanehirae]|uniref:Putative Vacuolar iron transporter family protein n=1 Tax=Cinnamomum micranthum f. kanehirae TaxID=337451 RepID=A0A3S3M768_9MAGN|nr:putative Vacuolar iron transporter family protein [Cinnamomum micranthum f. kanehirae]